MPMSAALAYGICTLALVSQFLLAVSLRQLRAGKADILATVSRRRIRLVLAAFFSAPVIAAVVVAGLNLFVFQSDAAMRTAHAAFSLGLWLVLAMSFIMLLLMYRLHRKPSLESLAGPVLTVALAAYVTPRPRFDWVYGEVGALLPLVVGCILVAVSMLLTWLARSELR